MPPYRGPERSNPYYAVKFIRTGSRLFVAKINEPIEHRDLARKDGILDQVEQLRLEKPLDVDAGLITVVQDYPRYGGDKIIISGVSSSLAIPTADEAGLDAREQTVIIFQE